MTVERPQIPKLFRSDDDVATTNEKPSPEFFKKNCLVSPRQDTAPAVAHAHSFKHPTFVAPDIDGVRR